RPRAHMLKRGPLLLLAAALAGVLGVALVAALAESSKDARSRKDQAAEDLSTSNPPLPDVIKDAPSDSEHGSSGGAASPAPTRAAAPSPSGPSLESAGSAAALRQAREEELTKARAAAIFVASEEGGPPIQPPAVELARRADAEHSPSSPPAATGPAAGEPARAPDPNLQERKNDFLARAGVSGAEYLEKTVSRPRSPYEVKAGTVIPTVLITGINSDLPGQVIAQVRENVYDTVSGNYLLIPQGSRLLAAYDSMVAWGQQRVLVCWNRLIRPDGSSITLDCMPGVDLAGYAGFSDEVDNHWWRIIGGAAVSSLLAATAQRSQGNVTGYQPSFPQVWAGGTAAGINEAGQQLTAKNLQLQPTITVRPGFSVNVLVTKDVVIDPYRQAEHQ
ncbi:MAG TPA: TrbI/VirB10 family protein, partial [Solirubrobacterales bacterium]|nr:TrbI/VirB10 family protein [Solirubrobacterales bacterium]